MKKLVLVMALFFSTGLFAEEWSFQKDNGDWKVISCWACPHHIKSWSVTGDGFDVTLDGTQRKLTGKCHFRYGTDSLKDFGVLIKLQCTENSFKVFLSQGYSANNAVNPNDLPDGSYFFVVLDEYSDVKPKPYTPSSSPTPVKKKEYREPSHRKY